jgi:NAD(P)H-hydrate epimerase
MRVADTQTISAIDKATIAAGTPGLDLMERAANGVCEIALGMLKGVRDPRVLVVCGKGNNGGDGFAAARLLARAGIQVTCLLLFARAEYRDDALRNLKHLKDTPVKTLGPLPVAQWPAFDRFHLIIDAIFGTGFTGSVKGDIRTCIGQINQSGAKVLAVDAPSGINSNTGGADGEAVFAHITATMGLPKIGHFFFPARVHVGELKIIDIGFSDAHANKLCKNVFMIGSDIARAGISGRRGDEHKNQCGKVLVVAGSTGLTGAACLAARAALKSGAGVVTVAVPKSLNPVFETKLTEEMTLPLNDAGRGTLGPSNSGPILKALAAYDVLALGPGISRNRSALALARSLVQKSPVPVVLDADGIFAFNRPTRVNSRDSPAPTVPAGASKESRRLKMRRSPWVSALCSRARPPWFVFRPA